MSNDERDELAPQEPVTIKLRRPITFGKKVIEEITVNPMKAKHLRRLKTPQERPMAMQLELAGYLTGEVDQVIDELQGRDLKDVLAAVNSFFADFLGTGTEE